MADQKIIVKLKLDDGKTADVNLGGSQINILALAQEVQERFPDQEYRSLVFKALINSWFREPLL